MRSLSHHLFGVFFLACTASSAGPAISEPPAVPPASPPARAPDCSARVRFPMGGTLEPGTLCDDIVLCLNGDDADAVRSAAFTCASEPSFPCNSPCKYAAPAGPHTLDPEEIGAMCDVLSTLPHAELVCVVYL